MDVPSQQAITRDNVALGIDGVLYMRIMDPKAASYGVENLMFAVSQLAQTTMRAEIGKLSLDDTLNPATTSMPRSPKPLMRPRPLGNQSAALRS